jgi:hypothetical protein
LPVLIGQIAEITENLFSPQIRSSTNRPSDSESLRDVDISDNGVFYGENQFSVTSVISPILPFQ